MDKQKGELTLGERLELAERAGEALAAAGTKDDVIAVWREHYMKLGHKALGRMLVGKDPGTAIGFERRQLKGEAV